MNIERFDKPEEPEEAKEEEQVRDAGEPEMIYRGGTEGTVPPDEGLKEITPKQMREHRELLEQVRKDVGVSFERAFDYLHDRILPLMEMRKDLVGVRGREDLIRVIESVMNFYLNLATRNARIGYRALKKLRLPEGEEPGEGEK